MTDPKEQFKTYIHQDTPPEKAINFLKKLIDKERKSLVPTIKLIQKDLGQIVQKERNVYGRKGSVNQLTLLSLAGYYCMSYQDYTRLFRHLPFWDDFFKKKMHHEFKPVWLEKLLNEEARNINYEQVMIAYKRGLVYSHKSVGCSGITHHHCSLSSTNQAEFFAGSLFGKTVRNTGRTYLVFI